MKLKKTKNILLMIASIMLVGLLTSCVDYKAELYGEDSRKEESVLEYTIGDADFDGKLEKVMIKNDALILYSGARVLGKYNLDSGKYISVNALYVDINRNGVSEIIIMLGTEENVFDAYLVELDGSYDLQLFPGKLNNNIVSSGIEANIDITGEFVYRILIAEQSINVDVSHLYKTSLLDVIGLQNAKEKWSKIEKSNYFGQILGISAMQVVKMADQHSVIRVYETVVGGDDQIIGELLLDITYNDTTDIKIENIGFIPKV